MADHELSVSVVVARKYFHRLEARLGGEYAGWLELRKRNWPPMEEGNIVVTDEIVSERPGMGIPRKLYKEAQNVMQGIADDTGIAVEHHMIAMTHESWEKISHLSADMGYEWVDEDFMYRVYRPSGRF